MESIDFLLLPHPITGPWVVPTAPATVLWVKAGPACLTLLWVLEESLFTEILGRVKVNQQGMEKHPETSTVGSLGCLELKGAVTI